MPRITINVSEPNYVAIVAKSSTIAAPSDSSVVESKECVVCTEQIGNGRERVVCPHCPLKDETCVCKKCVQTYLLGLKKPAECMFCRIPWTTSLLFKVMPRAFVTGVYRKHLQKLYVDREKALLPETMGLVQVAINRKKLRLRFAKTTVEIGKNAYMYKRLVFKIFKLKQADVITAEIKEKISNTKRQQKELLEQKRQLYLEKQRLANDINSGGDSNAVRHNYILPCPAEGCKGFI